MKTEKSHNLVVSMMSDMTPSVRKYIDPEITVMEVLPPLMEIIQPNMRPVSVASPYSAPIS